MNLEKPNNCQQAKSNAQTESNKQCDESGPEVSSATTQSQSKPSPCGSEIACKKRDWIDKVTLGLEGFGLFVLIVYTIATIVYACITKQMWTEMQQQTCIQRNAAMNAERAWLGLDSAPRVEIVSLEHDKFQAVIQIMGRNFGKGPALKVMSDMRIVTSGVDDNVQSSCHLIFPFVGLKPKWPSPFAPDESLSKHEWGQVVFPGQPFGNIGNYSGGNVVNVVGKEAYVIGCIVYKDQFSEPHWTKFCYNTGDFAKDAVKDASSFKHLFLCSTNNYTDETEKKQPPCPVTAVRE
jgi:hypothetical protein